MKQKGFAVLVGMLAMALGGCTDDGDPIVPHAQPWLNGGSLGGGGRSGQDSTGTTTTTATSTPSNGGSLGGGGV